MRRTHRPATPKGWRVDELTSVGAGLEGQPSVEAQEPVIVRMSCGLSASALVESPETKSIPSVDSGASSNEMSPAPVTPVTAVWTRANATLPKFPIATSPLRAGLAFQFTEVSVQPVAVL